MTPLHLAAKSGQLEIVKFLLELNASLSATDAYGQNALEIAMNYNRRYSRLPNFLIMKTVACCYPKKFKFTVYHTCRVKYVILFISLIICIGIKNFLFLIYHNMSISQGCYSGYGRKQSNIGRSQEAE